jgi:short-chain Z-isoprenyl diphosphate synthase
MVSELVYRLYERRLTAGLRGQPLPRHIGVILDGNRRFARAKGLGTVSEGHRIGAEKIHELLDWCHELEIPYVTLWLLSTENLARDSAEVDELVGIIARTVERIAYEPANEARGVRLSALGALDAIPDRLRRTLKEAEEATAERDGMHVQVAVGYGGRREITDALRSLLEERHTRGESLEQVIADLAPDDISAHLYSTGTPDPDLIIRTSGEIRLSGFLLWQSAHSEFYFCDPYWPEFRKTDFLRALREFASRQRRYGR